MGLGNYFDNKELIEKAKDKLKDYYGTASLVNPTAMVDLIRIDISSDDEILEEAKKLNLI